MCLLSSIFDLDELMSLQELNSRGRKFPVKLRTRIMHKQVDRIYELKEYMRFHSRSFKKLLKLQETMRKSPDDEFDPVWDEMDDTVEDLDQYDYYMDTLKERFLNLIELVSNSRRRLADVKAYSNVRSSTSRTQINRITLVSCPSLQHSISPSPILL